MDQISRLRAIGIDRDELVWAVFDQSPDCIKVLDLRGCIEYMNPNGQKALELASLDDVAGRYLPDLWPEPGRARLQQGIECAASGGKDRFDAWCPTSKGADRWWQVNLSLVRDGRGRPSHILCTSRDISASHVEAEERAADFETLIAQRVAAELAHQARNQSAVIGALARVSLGSEGIKPRERLMERVGKVLTAIDSVAQAGKTVPVAGVVGRALGTLSDRPRFAVSPVIDVWVTGESSRIIAVILGELESNALTHGAFSGAGGSVNLRVDATEAGHIDFTWTECLDRAPAATPESGTGMRLIDRLSSVLPKPADYRWSNDGFCMTFTVEAA